MAIIYSPMSICPGKLQLLTLDYLFKLKCKHSLLEVNMCTTSPLENICIVQILKLNKQTNF